MIAARIWRLLRERGPLTAAQVAVRLGVTQAVAMNGCRRLRRDGFISDSGPYHGRLYTTVGETCPSDRRGQNMRSHVHLPKARAALTEKQERVEPAPIPCALAEAWGWMRSFPDCADDEAA